MPLAPKHGTVSSIPEHEFALIGGGGKQVGLAFDGTPAEAAPIT